MKSWQTSGGLCPGSGVIAVKDLNRGFQPQAEYCPHCHRAVIVGMKRGRFRPHLKKGK